MILAKPAGYLTAVYQL